MVRSAHFANPLLVQQQALGNQAMQRLLRSGVVQAKLTVSPPGDPYEQEADRVAEAVMRMPEPGKAEGIGAFGSASVPTLRRMCPECQEDLHRSPSRIQRLCPECEEEEKTLQAKTAPGHTPAVTPDLEAQVTALRGRGQPLPASVRAFFEPRFGHDFGQVRVHSDAKAAESARAVGARAYTVGRHIVFGASEYPPAWRGGNWLVAHELAHVIQQGVATPFASGSRRVSALQTTSMLLRPTLQRQSIAPSMCPNLDDAVGRWAGPHAASQIRTIYQTPLGDSPKLLRERVWKLPSKWGEYDTDVYFQRPGRPEQHVKLIARFMPTVDGSDYVEAALWDWVGGSPVREGIWQGVLERAEDGNCRIKDRPALPRKKKKRPPGPTEPPKKPGKPETVAV
jgi:hypothetical protein